MVSAAVWCWHDNAHGTQVGTVADDCSCTAVTVRLAEVSNSPMANFRWFCVCQWSISCSKDISARCLGTAGPVGHSRYMSASTSVARMVRHGSAQMLCCWKRHVLGSRPLVLGPSLLLADAVLLLVVAVA
jgi:hypothetical protein